MTNRLTPAQHRAVLTIKPWLIADRESKPLSRMSFHPGGGYRTSKEIYEKIIPKGWAWLQDQQTILKLESGKDALHDARLRIGRASLKLCEQARVAYIHKKIAGCVFPFEELEAKTWSDLDKYVTAVTVKGVPLPGMERLSMPVHEAVNTYTGGEHYGIKADHTFLGMVGLTATLLSTLRGDEKDRAHIMVQEPGRDDDRLVEWNFNPLKQR